MFLFAPSDLGHWYPMAGIKELPEEIRRQALLDGARRIYNDNGIGASPPSDYSAQENHRTNIDHESEEIMEGFADLVAMLCKLSKADNHISVEEINIIEEKCEGCGVCEHVCPVDAIEMVQRKSGEVYISKSRFGWIVHAELKAGEETSGKLVSVVRQKAMEVAKENGYETIIIDSSAGIGCPVIASITGVSIVVIVVEPTMAAIHDMKRIMDVANHFKIPYVVCINKYDLNEEKALEIEKFCNDNGIEIIGKIPYNNAFTHAIVNGKSVVEYDEKLASLMKEIWENVERKIEKD